MTSRVVSFGLTADFGESGRYYKWKSNGCFGVNLDEDVISIGPFSRRL